jgi:hypothetical protein
MQLFSGLKRLVTNDSLHMKNIITICLALFAGSLLGQNQDLRPFNSINVFGPFQIELIASDKEAIEMEPVNIKRDDIIMEVKRGELRLKIRSRHYWSDWDSNKHKRQQYIKTKVYYKSLIELQASAGAEVRFNEPVLSNKFFVYGNMGAEIYLPIETNVLYAKSNMGATVNLKGKANYLEVLGKMGSVVKASQLITKSAYVSASMGSEVSIYASDEIDIAANFGSEVKYSGDPAVRHTNKKMGADIHGH